MKKLCVLWKKESAEIRRLAAALTGQLKAQGYRLLPVSQIQKSELVLATGGDGTILRTVRLLKGKKIPVLGVYCGGLGFLTEVTPYEVIGAVGKIAKKQFSLDARHKLEVTVTRRKRTIAVHEALNDITITKTGIARVISFEVVIGKNFLGHLKADGALVNTATGSTAYSLSLNGPILSPDSPDLVFNPICSHSLAHRPVITHSPIEITLTSTLEAALTIDGQIILPLKKGDRITTAVAKNKAYFARLEKFDLFQELREKMGWE